MNSCLGNLGRSYFDKYSFPTGDFTQKELQRMLIETRISRGNLIIFVNLLSTPTHTLLDKDTKRPSIKAIRVWRKMRPMTALNISQDTQEIPENNFIWDFPRPRLTSNNKEVPKIVS